MFKDIKELKKERPELVERFENLSKDELVKQCCLEAIDAINMEERVQLFMNECTISMSKTTYTIASLEKMIADKKEYDLNMFCFGLLYDELPAEDVMEEIKKRADKIEM